MKVHMIKTQTKIINEIELHFKLQSALQNGVGAKFEFWDTITIDVYEEYIFQCNLKDIEPNIEDYKKLRYIIKHYLVTHNYYCKWLDKKNIKVYKL